jgi:GNAT superfamily N-acetyltransferase
MQRQRISMTFDEYDLLEQPFGYKVEYWDGHTVITPRDNPVTTRLVITARGGNPTCHIVPVDPARQQEMAETFFAAFHDTVEFCGWYEHKIREHADSSIKRYFAGKRGEPHPASVMALAEDGSISGIALLLTDTEGEVCLDLLYVVPSYQRQHIATQMVATAVNSLHATGIATLTSTYHICNEDSRRWHHAFGFVDVYDQMYIRLKYAWYRNEIWRREKLGLTKGLDALAAERDCWYAQLDEMWRH